MLFHNPKGSLEKNDKDLFLESGVIYDSDTDVKNISASISSYIFISPLESEFNIKQKYNLNGKRYSARYSLPFPQNHGFYGQYRDIILRSAQNLKELVTLESSLKNDHRTENLKSEFNLHAVTLNQKLAIKSELISNSLDATEINTKWSRNYLIKGRHLKKQYNGHGAINLKQQKETVCIEGK